HLPTPFHFCGQWLRPGILTPGERAGPAAHSGGTVADSHGLPFLFLALGENLGPYRQQRSAARLSQTSPQQHPRCTTSPFSLSRENVFVKLPRLVNNGNIMKTRILVALLVVGAFLPWATAAKERKQTGPPAPIGWLDLHAGSRDFSVSLPDLQKVTHNLARGALLPV